MRSWSYTAAFCAVFTAGVFYASAGFSEANRNSAHLRGYTYRFANTANAYKYTQTSKPFAQNGSLQEVPEVELLGNLDKETRAMYNSMSDEGKRLARELAARSVRRGGQRAQPDYSEAVEEAVSRMVEQREKQQQRWLQSGMDRLPVNQPS